MAAIISAIMLKYRHFSFIFTPSALWTNTWSFADCAMGEYMVFCGLRYGRIHGLLRTALWANTWSFADCAMGEYKVFCGLHRSILDCTKRTVRSFSLACVARFSLACVVSLIRVGYTLTHYQTGPN